MADVMVMERFKQLLEINFESFAAGWTNLKASLDDPREAYWAILDIQAALNYWYDRFNEWEENVMDQLGTSALSYDELTPYIDRLGEVPKGLQHFTKILFGDGWGTLSAWPKGGIIGYIPEVRRRQGRYLALPKAVERNIKVKSEHMFSTIRRIIKKIGTQKTKWELSPAGARARGKGYWPATGVPPGVPEVEKVEVIEKGVLAAAYRLSKLFKEMVTVENLSENPSLKDPVEKANKEIAEVVKLALIDYRSYDEEGEKTGLVATNYAEAKDALKDLEKDLENYYGKDLPEKIRTLMEEIFKVMEYLGRVIRYEKFAEKKAREALIERKKKALEEVRVKVKAAKPVTGALVPKTAPLAGPMQDNRIEVDGNGRPRILADVIKILSVLSDNVDKLSKKYGGKYGEGSDKQKKVIALKSSIDGLVEKPKQVNKLESFIRALIAFPMDDEILKGDDTIPILRGLPGLTTWSWWEGRGNKLPDWAPRKIEAKKK